MKVRFVSRKERPTLNPVFKRFQILPDFAVLAVARGVQSLTKLPQETMAVAAQPSERREEPSMRLSA